MTADGAKISNGESSVGFRNCDESLSGQMRRLERELVTLREIIRRDGYSIGTTSESLELRKDVVREAIQSRANRLNFVPANLFADPAWDMLLELYMASLAQYRVPISSLSAASMVPSTTSLRWIKVLENEGLVSRTSDPFDGRRWFVGLTTAGLAAMDGYFAIKAK